MVEDSSPRFRTSSNSRPTWSIRVCNLTVVRGSLPHGQELLAAARTARARNRRGGPTGRMELLRPRARQSLLHRRPRSHAAPLRAARSIPDCVSHDHRNGQTHGQDRTGCRARTRRRTRQSCNLPPAGAPARVGTVGPRRSPFFRTPCSLGSRPVMIVTCDGSVSGTAVRARVNRRPASASASSVGVKRRCTRSARSVSIVDEQDVRACGSGHCRLAASNEQETELPAERQPERRG